MLSHLPEKAKAKAGDDCPANGRPFAFVIISFMKRNFGVVAACALAAFLIGCSNTANTNAPAAQSKVSNSTNPAAGAPANYPPAPSAIANAPFELLDGEQTRISDKKGKVVLVNLWATWCGPCRQEIPELVAMQEKYKDKNFQVIGLHVVDNDGQQQGVPEVKTFAERFKINYAISRIPQELSTEYFKYAQFSGVPITIVIDREGRIRGVFKGGGGAIIAQMKDTVDRVVNES